MEFFIDAEDSKMSDFLFDINEPFYSEKNMAILDKQFNDEIKLIHLLNQYGGKFSSPKLVFYKFEPIKKVK